MERLLLFPIAFGVPNSPTFECVGAVLPQRVSAFADPALQDADMWWARLGPKNLYFQGFG